MLEYKFYAITSNFDEVMPYKARLSISHNYAQNVQNAHVQTFA